MVCAAPLSPSAQTDNNISSKLCGDGESSLLAVTNSIIPQVSGMQSTCGISLGQVVEPGHDLSHAILSSLPTQDDVAQVEHDLLQTAVLKTPYLLPSSTLSPDEDFNLNIFTHDLPDPSRELFYQWTPITYFPLFKKLPLEIRRKIWGYNRGRKLFVFFQDSMLLRYRAPTPTILKVCQESRNEWFMYYKDPLQVYVKGQYRPALSQFYFDPKTSLRELGRASINSCWMFTLDQPMGMVWICSESSPNKTQGFKRQVDTFKLFTSLESLILVGGRKRKCTNLRFDHQRVSCVKGLTEMFEKIRGRPSGQGGVEVSVLMKCHQPGAVSCGCCFLGLSKEEVRERRWD
ncbi:hypothetical protein DL95DRAFT_406579 [Leptodontidium sp. 2 PMI_412]|nr:hypothetical protein DL95DRAFT_406579 [Leptodontidium sp. 2 PMI_412]